MKNIKKTKKIDRLKKRIVELEQIVGLQNLTIKMMIEIDKNGKEKGGKQNDV